MPIYLNVPYSEKDKVKALGARWDATPRQWYVPEGVLLTPFEPWLPEFKPDQPVETAPVPKNQATGKAPGKARLSDPAVQARGDRIDTIQGKVITGPLYVDLSHDCIPWEHCEQCAEAMAQRSRPPIDPMLSPPWSD